MKLNLAGKKIWIIGASTGIGRELAKCFANSGATVLVSARSKAKLDELQVLFPHRVFSYPLDVRIDVEIKKVYEEIKTATGVPDILIFNAGIYRPMNGAELDGDYALRLLDINLNGLVRVVSAILPDLISRGSGQLAGVASVVGYRGLPRAAAYGASKAAMINFLESLRFDVRKHGVSVSIVNPGFVKTQLTDKNEFAMPFCISAAAAAEEIFNGILQCKDEIHFPKRFSYLMKLMRILPYPLYDKLVSRKVT